MQVSILRRVGGEGPPHVKAPGHVAQTMLAQRQCSPGRAGQAINMVYWLVMD